MKIDEKEIAEHSSLYHTLMELHKRLIVKRKVVFELLKETASQRQKTISVLHKANRINRYLTGRQRELTGFTYNVNVSKKINLHQNLPDTHLPAINPGCKSIIELKQQVLLILSLIDDVKKRLLQLELLEKRCRELILSMKKGLVAFHNEFRIIRRKLFPFGIFSLLYRHLRKLLGKTYFTFRDLDDITALGKMTGLVLKIAYSPLV